MSQAFPILFIGDAERQEFTAAAKWLQERGARLVADIPTALRVLEDSDFFPAVIVLARLGSEPFAAEQIEKLRGAAPLARMIRLLGPWLEGESRSGRPLAASFRASWEQWSGRIRQPVQISVENLESKQTVTPSLWSLPFTATEDDRILTAVGGEVLASFSSEQVPRASVAAPSLLIAVHAQHRETAHTLCDICHAQGWKSLWLRTLLAETPVSVNAVLFDLAAIRPPELKLLKAMKEIVGAAPVIALVGFPRPEDIGTLQSAGASAVISKPFLANDLIWQTQQLLLSPSAV